VWRDHKGARKAKGLVWPGKGGKMAAHGHDAGWSRLREIAELRHVLRFHDLRHTCASHLVSGSWGRAWRLEEVCDVLGHSELKTTQRYAHLSPESILGAAEQAREQWSSGGGCQVGAAPVIPIR
jgi:site-specific recombinase XerD